MGKCKGRPKELYSSWAAAYDIVLQQCKETQLAPPSYALCTCPTPKPLKLKKNVSKLVPGGQADPGREWSDLAENGARMERPYWCCEYVQNRASFKDRGGISCGYIQPADSERARLQKAATDPKHRIATPPGSADHRVGNEPTAPAVAALCAPYVPDCEELERIEGEVGQERYLEMGFEDLPWCNAAVGHSPSRSETACRAAKAETSGNSEESWGPAAAATGAAATLGTAQGREASAESDEHRSSAPKSKAELSIPLPPPAVEVSSASEEDIATGEKTAAQTGALSGAAAGPEPVYVSIGGAGWVQRPYNHIIYYFAVAFAYKFFLPVAFAIAAAQKSKKEEKR